MNLAIGSRVISSAVDPTPIGTFKENVTLVFSYEKASSFFFLLLLFLISVENSTIKEYYVFPFVSLFVQYVVCVCVWVGGGGGQEGGGFELLLLFCCCCFPITIVDSCNNLF